MAVKSMASTIYIPFIYFLNGVWLARIFHLPAMIIVVLSQKFEIVHHFKLN